MKKYFGLIMMFLILSLTSCDKTIVGPTIILPGTGSITTPKVIPTNSEGEFGIIFGNYEATTRATAVSVLGNGYDAFSLFAWNNLNNVIMNPYTVQADASGQGGYDYTTVQGQELQYFKNNTQNYEFIGIIPTTHTMSLNNGEVTVEGLTSFTADDKRVEGGNLEADSDDEFLYVYKKVEKAQYGSQVTLPFAHGNALIYLGFKSDRDDTELLDYTPYTPGTPEVPATPGTTTTTIKSTKFIDELVAGNVVQVGIGFYGANSPKLTKSNPNPLYVGADNTSNGYLAKTWLLSIKDAVNAQFEYYKLTDINGTTYNPTTDDWESAASNKNIYMMKLADGVNATDFANGNDAFATALKAHQTDWVGGSPAESFWAMFEQAYADGWRVIRINVNDANANQVLVFLSSNQNINTKVTETTGGTPYQPAVPATGQSGVRVFSASHNGTNYVHKPHTTVADAIVSATSLAFDNRTTSDEVITFSLPSTTTLSSTPVYSPTTFYAIPGDNGLTHIVVKLSYTYNGVTVYDVRVPIVLPTNGLEPGKYYKYVINIKSTANGNDSPNDAETDKDDIDAIVNPVINVTLNHQDYSEGANETYDI